MLASPAQIKAVNPIHVLRGIQLAFLGAIRALQNPQLFTSEHYKQAIVAVLAGLALNLLTALPMFLLRGCVTVVSLFADLSNATWHDDIFKLLHFIQHWVVSVPFILLNLFQNFDPEPFDQLFMTSMTWVDRIYKEKHRNDDLTKLRPFYVLSLKRYAPVNKNEFFNRTLKRSVLALLIYSASFVPAIGQFVLPALSFYSLHQAIGLVPAGVIFSIAGLFLPRHYFVIFLQTYFSTRSLTRQLLNPYFSRIPYNKYQKAKWYREREGVLFGFSLPFYLALRIPYLGILAYGIASASAAFLVSKVSNPPPDNRSELGEYIMNELSWTAGRRNIVKAGYEKLIDFDRATEAELAERAADVETHSNSSVTSEKTEGNGTRVGSDEEWVDIADKPVLLK